MNKLHYIITYLFLSLFALTSTPLVAQGQGQAQIPQETTPLEVNVRWGQTTLQDPSKTRQGLYEIMSDGFVQINKTPSTFQLQIRNPEAPSEVITLCRFSTNAQSFVLRYPGCASINELDDVHAQIKKDIPYQLYFADEAGNVINSQEGQGVITLPALSARNFLNVDAQVQTIAQTKERDEQKIIAVTIDVLQSKPGSTFKVAVRNANSPEVNEMLLTTIDQVEKPDENDTPEEKGTFPAKQSTRTFVSEGLQSGLYEVVITLDGESFAIYEGLRIEEDNGVEGGQTARLQGVNTNFELNTTQIDIQSNGLVPDCGYDIKTFSNQDGKGVACGFTHLIELVQRIIEYIFLLILPIATLVFVYIGWTLLSSGGNSQKRSAAKSAAKNLITGIFLVVCAWLIIRTIVVSLGVDESIYDTIIDFS